MLNTADIHVRLIREFHRYRTSVGQPAMLSQQQRVSSDFTLWRRVSVRLDVLKEALDRRIRGWRRAQNGRLRPVFHADPQGVKLSLIEEERAMSRTIATTIIDTANVLISEVRSDPGAASTREHLLTFIARKCEHIANEAFKKLQRAHLTIIKRLNRRDRGKEPLERPPINDDPWSAFADR